MWKDDRDEARRILLLILLELVRSEKAEERLPSLTRPQSVVGAAFSSLKENLLPEEPNFGPVIILGQQNMVARWHFETNRLIHFRMFI